MAYSDFGSDSGFAWCGTTQFVEDLIGPDKGYARGPERGLLSAVLFDGVQNYMNYACAKGEKQKAKYSEAFTWVNRRGADYIFAFDSVCEALGVNAEFLRLGLINAANSLVDEWKRGRRNF